MPDPRHESERSCMHVTGMDYASHPIKVLTCPDSVVFCAFHFNHVAKFVHVCLYYLFQHYLLFVSCSPNEYSCNAAHINNVKPQSIDQKPCYITESISISFIVKFTTPKTCNYY